MTTIWANFAKTGEPIPNDNALFANVTWEKYTSKDEKYLDIGSELVTKTGLNSDRMKLWDELFPAKPLPTVWEFLSLAENWKYYMKAFFFLSRHTYSLYRIYLWFPNLLIEVRFVTNSNWRVFSSFSWIGINIWDCVVAFKHCSVLNKYFLSFVAISIRSFGILKRFIYINSSRSLASWIF